MEYVDVFAILAFVVAAATLFYAVAKVPESKE